jgi:MFS family permease
LRVVFSTILIDFTGFSVLIPVLPLLADRMGATPTQVGLMTSLYALAQLLFLPAWGWVSDRVGRRPVLLVSLLGTAVSFLLLAYAGSIGAFYFARVLAGFFAASIGTAQAVVTDLTTPSERAHGMGMIGAAFGIGMVAGPILGGVLASLHPQAPFYGMAALAAANLLFALWALPESRPAHFTRPSWRDFTSALVPTPLRLFLQVHDRRIALYLVLFFLFSGFAVVEAMVTLYLGHRFGADAVDAALIFAVIGLALALTQGVLLRRLLVVFGEMALLLAGILVMSVGLACVPLAPALRWFFLLGPLIAVGNGIAFPSFTSLYSKACREENAGELLGQSNAMATAGRIVGATAGGALMTDANPGAPFLAAAAALALALFVILGLRGRLLKS